ncbi:hypothetical protein TNCT_396351 [Trichonephila clavata]|uniref:Uncharacterized protein n=1 Tax=Trichonephila clavata TaxID=2740835 RepID=A0A8X6GMJ1_TRICU|nr:hypothetical protein TNCT_396351 [Trichonephila clavata]
MITFHILLSKWKPSEIIPLEPLYSVDLAEKLHQILPNHDPRDVPSLANYCYFVPADLHSDYLEEEATNGKGAFIHAIWTYFGKPSIYNLAHMAW